MPRYYNQQQSASVIPYVSAYDPSFDNNLINLQNQEYTKAATTQAALAERAAQIGDIFSHDTKGKEQVVSKFKDNLTRTKELYNNDLA